MVQMQDVMSKPMPDFREGSIVKGRILEVRPREVLVDIGYKSEGVIPITEFDDVDSLEVGDEVDVLLERLENNEGMVVLSKEKAAYRQNWNKIVHVFEGDGLIKGKVKSVVKGGLMVNIGVEAFLPASQIDVVPPKDLQQFVGNTYDFKIVKINQDRKNIVLCRREVIEQERSEKRQKFMEGVNVGDRERHGKEYHRLRRVHRPRWHGWPAPHHRYDLGPHRSSQRVAQGRPGIRSRRARHQQGKRTRLPRPQADPEQSVGPDRGTFPVGSARSKARSSISCLTARLWKSNPASKASCTSPNFPGPSASREPSDVLKAGQEIEAVVLGINREEQKISLGIRQLEPNPWDEIEEKYPPSAPRSKARFATSPATALSSSWKKASTA